MKRLLAVRWLLSTLLGSFVISALILYLPRLLSFDPAGLGFPSLYLMIAVVKTVADITAYLLVTPPWARREPEEEALSW